MSRFPEPQRSSDILWWKDARSTSEIADRLARSHVDKQQLESRVAELLQENSLLRLRASNTETERLSLNTEIAGLEAELGKARHRLQEFIAPGRREAESSARDRLLKDDLERKLEALQVELNRERQRSAKQIQELQRRLSNCICGDICIEHKSDHPEAAPSGLPKRWTIRNSK
jgi:hypothetical protein